MSKAGRSMKSPSRSLASSRVEACKKTSTSSPQDSIKREGQVCRSLSKIGSTTLLTFCHSFEFIMSFSSGLVFVCQKPMFERAQWSASNITRAVMGREGSTGWAAMHSFPQTVCREMLLQRTERGRSNKGRAGSRPGPCPLRIGVGAQKAEASCQCSGATALCKP